MVITFFGHKGIVYTHAVAIGHKANAEYYRNVLETLPRDHISNRNNPSPTVQSNLTPCNFFLYPTAKTELKEHNAVKALEAVFKQMAKNGFAHVFQAWQKR